jgi:ATP-dependent Lon protease
MPLENQKDMADLPPNLKSAMKLHFVGSMDEVLKIALEGPLPEIHEETPDVLVNVPPPAQQPTAPQ